MKFKPEEKVEIGLWDWLNKFEGIKVYFNQKKKWYEKNTPTFTTKGKSREQPDLIICFFNEFNGEEYLATEVKDGTIEKNLHDSGKIFYKYYKNYIQGKTKYFINNQEIKISHFVIATQFSKLGKLIYSDKRVTDNIDKGDDINKGENKIWRNMSAQNKTLPRCEYEKTHFFLRGLWANFKPFREKLTDVKPSLGILVSDILTTFHPEELKIQSGMIGKPVIEIMQWKDWLKKPQWAQNIIKIGKEKKKYG